MQNMLGTMVEEMLANWTMAKLSIMDTRTHMVLLNEILTTLESNVTGGKFSLFCKSTPHYDFGLNMPGINSEGLDGKGSAQLAGIAMETEVHASGSTLHDSPGVVAAEVPTPILGSTSGSVSPAAVVLQGGPPPEPPSRFLQQLIRCTAKGSEKPTTKLLLLARLKLSRYRAGMKIFLAAAPF